MKISRRTPLAGVAKAVAAALADHGIRAVLTGGACATIYSEGAHTSEDLDFVLEGRVTPAELDEAMGSVGFERESNRYVHPHSSFWVEFPRGPLGIGSDLDLKPVPFDRSDRRTLALSPTDSVRDRLAAFFHWSDRQALDAAIAIAARHPVKLDRIRTWSRKEGHAERFEEFRRELALRKRRPS